MRLFSNKFFELTTIKSSLLIAVLGFCVFFSGLSNQFVGDDISQIVDNIPVHSIANLPLFFDGGTFYNGQGLTPLSGAYYRPLMMTAFSMIYSLFGPNPLAYHALQLLLHILCTIVLFLVFRYFFKPALALVLALIFLVHPINSQAVFSIAAMQEPLFFLFGILAVWTLPRFQDRSPWFLILTAFLLFVSLLAKETGILFIAVSLLYVFIADKKRFYLLTALSAGCIFIYLLLKVHAVGTFVHPDIAPIADLDLWGRMLNSPAIMLFYFAKFIYPVTLAHGYFWTFDSFSLRNVLLPLTLDIGIIILTVYLAHLLRSKAPKRYFILFIFFSYWLGLGLLMHLQVVPLDFTICETWFYFPIVGLLGMIGVILEAFSLWPRRWWVMAIVALVIATLGLRTMVRGLDWHDQYTLAYRDATVSPGDYASENLIAYDLARQGKFNEAKSRAEHSISLRPAFSNYDTLGIILNALGDYPGAKKAFISGLKYRSSYLLYENLAIAMVRLNAPSEDTQIISAGLKKFPEDGKLWLALGILEARSSDGANAKQAIMKARKYGYYDQYLYNKMMDNEPFTLTLDPRPQ